MLRTLLAAASLTTIAFATPAFAQQNSATPGQTMEMKRGSGTTATGSSELPANNNPAAGASTPADASVIGRDDPQHQNPPTPGDTLNLQRGQGSAVTGASEVSKNQPVATGAGAGAASSGSMTQGSKATSGDVLNVKRGQGSAVTGSSELGKKQ